VHVPTVLRNDADARLASRGGDRPARWRDCAGEAGSAVFVPSPAPLLYVRGEKVRLLHINAPQSHMWRGGE
jgi:hypothetical protein